MKCLHVATESKENLMARQKMYKVQDFLSLVGRILSFIPTGRILHLEGAHLARHRDLQVTKTFCL